MRRVLQKSDTPYEALEPLLQRSECFSLPAGRTVYTPATSAHAIYALRRGAVKLLRLDEGGTRHLVGWMAAGGVIGLEGVFGERYRHSAVAIEPLGYCRIPQAVIRSLEGAGHGFYRELARLWQANMDECDSFIATLSAGTAKKRLARLLLKHRRDA